MVGIADTQFGITPAAVCAIARPTARSTLRQLYCAAYQPLHCAPLHLSDKTANLYGDALGYWERLTGDPPIGDVDDYVAAMFVAALQTAPGRRPGSTLSIATTRKHAKTVQTLFDFAGPRSRTNRQALGILPVVPFFPIPSPDVSPPKDFTLAELRAMFCAADAMDTPAAGDVTPAAWWRAFLVFAFSTGLRVGEIMRLTPGDCCLDATPPFVSIKSGYAKRRRGRRKFLSTQAADLIRPLTTTGKPRVFWFPNWDRNPRWHQAQFKRLAAAAGLPACRRFGFHGIRKAHANAVASLSGSVAVAQASLGHSSPSVTVGHYLSPATIDGLQAETIRNLPALAE